MNETVWLTGESYRSMLEHMRRQRPGLRTNRGKRRFRLFAAQCIRLLPVIQSYPSAFEYLELCDQFADQFLSREQFTTAAGEAARLTPGSDWDSGMMLMAMTRLMHKDTRWAVSVWKWLTERSSRLDYEGNLTWTKTAIDEAVLPHLVRDIFGNPFRPITFSPEWRTTTAAAIAQGMYDSRDFGPMPLLADALQDAGCEVSEIIDHCRGPGPHVRGCWVVDGVLGK